MPLPISWQTVEIAIVLVLVVVVFVGFVREKLAPDVVAVLALGVLVATGILGTQEALSVFSSGAPVAIAALFVLSAALERTGVIDIIGRRVATIGGTSPLRALVAMMLAVAVFSGFINNTPTVVVLTPVAISLAQGLGIAPSRLLIPLSFASIFGGTTTLLGTSTNLLVDDVARSQGLAPFGMFEITALGYILALAGTIYMVLIGRHLLPDRPTLAQALPDPSRRHFLAEFIIPDGSSLVGRTPRRAGFGEAESVELVDVIRGAVSMGAEGFTAPLAVGDRVILRTNAADVMGLREGGKVTFDRKQDAGGDGANGGSARVAAVANQPATVMEGIVGPQSSFSGRRIGDLNLGRAYGVYILAVHRNDEDLRTNLDNIRLRFGDTLLLEGPPEGLSNLFDRGDLTNLSAPRSLPRRRHKAPLALAAVVGVMVLAALNVLPIASLALIAAGVVVAGGCLTADEAYGAIHWRILMLIFGMLAVGMAMDKTGAARLIVDGAADLVEGFGPLVVLSMVYLVTSVLTELMTNNAVAILLTPIAAGLAHQLGVDPRPFVVAVMFAASASFATPIGYQTNTFVYSAGGYRFLDFVKVGLPLNLLFWALATFLIPVFWPL